MIALVEGGVLGGTCEVEMACEFAIAADTATFTLTPARLGVPYNIGGTLNMMQSMSLPRIKELLFRARPIVAAAAQDARFVDHVEPAPELDAARKEVADDVLQNGRSSSRS